MYRSLFRRHIEPGLGARPIGEIDPAVIRGRRLALVQAGVSSTMIAKSYRLIRAMLMTAVDDSVLARNPCRIKAGGAESAPERPVLIVEQVIELSIRVPVRFRALVLVAAFGSLRWGEVVALRQRDVELSARVVHVRSAIVELSSGKLLRGEPKSWAGVRSVALPGFIVEQLREHLAAFADPGLDALAFPGIGGQPLRRSNFNRQADWSSAVAAVGAPGLHFHDLRHTGNTLAAETGASLRDLMARMGHDSMQAALIYQHRTRGADQKIADGLAALLPPDGVARGLHDGLDAGPVRPGDGEAEAV